MEKPNAKMFHRVVFIYFCFNIFHQTEILENRKLGENVTIITIMFSPFIVLFK